MKEQTNPFFDLANIVDAGQYKERLVRTQQPGDTGTITLIKRNPFYGIPADLLQAAHNLTIRNPDEMTGAEVLSQMAGIPSIAKTLDRLSGGFQLHSGSGQATQMLPETRDALLAVAPLAIKPTVAVAKAAVPAAKAVGRGALAAAQSDTAYDLANRVASATGASPLYAVKPKGGNWAPSYSGSDFESVARAVEPLRRKPAGDAQLSAQDTALNRWLDKKLTPYVRNEMGTPDDPIRLAHEQGYSHSPQIRGMEENVAGAWTPQRVADARSAAGFPEEGFAVRRHAEAGYPEENLLNTRRAEEWEIISDRAIDPNTAGVYQEDTQELRGLGPKFANHPGLKMAEKNPWIEKLDPNTPIYRIADSHTFSSDLDFNHLMDELRASLSPNSELPAHLRLTPDKLNKVSVADAVKRVSEINDWRALEAAKAERAGMLENLNSNARLADPTAKLSFVEKPGLTWADIPEVIDEKGIKLCTSIGKAGGWCTMNSDTAQHYGSGNARLTALLDAEGRPHAQAMIVKSTKSPYDEWFDKNGGDVKAPEVAEFLSWVEARARSGGSKMNSDQLYLDWAAETGRPIVQPAQNIEELKPPGNAFSSDRAKAYEKRDPDYQKKVSDSVVKFLNSGEWGHVNDLYHYGITDVKDKNSWLRVLQRVSPERDIEKAMNNFSSVLASDPDLPRFMTDKDIARLLGAPPAEGYAKGGAVHMQVGGLAKLPSLARRLFKTPVAELGRAGTMSKAGARLSETFSPEDLENIQNSLIVMRRGTLADIAGSDKRLKSVHETNRTGASVGPLRSKQVRAEREPEMFGDIGQTYGYLTLDPLSTLKLPFEVKADEKLGVHIRPQSYIPQYGRFGLELHPGLRDRATFTINDSLDRTLGPKVDIDSILRPSGPTTEVAVPGSRLHDLALGYDATMRNIVARLQSQGFQGQELQKRLSDELAKINAPGSFAELLRSEGLAPIGGSSYSRLPAQIPRRLSDPTETPLLPSEIYSLGDEEYLYDKLLQRIPKEYVEVQMHGDITPEHIRRIYDFGYEPSLQAEKQAKKLGIEYAPRPEAAYDIIKREKPKTLGEFFEMAEELGVAPENERLRHSVNRMLPFGGNYEKGGAVNPHSTNPFDHLV